VYVLNIETAVFARYAVSSLMYIVCFAFTRILACSSLRLFFRLCTIKQKHGKALKISHKALVPVKLLLQSWTKCMWSSLLAFWNKPNRPVSDDQHNATYPAVS